MESKLTPVIPEVRLWRAFLDQMILDTFTHAKGTPEEILERRESKDWLYDRKQTYYPDFDKVCEMAHVTPESVEKVIKYMEEQHA